MDIDENSLGEQTLPNFYAEDLNNCMNRERRREALAKFLRTIKADIGILKLRYQSQSKVLTLFQKIF